MHTAQWHHFDELDLSVIIVHLKPVADATHVPPFQ